MSKKREDASRRRVNLSVRPFGLSTGETDPCGTGAHPPRPEGRGFPLILLMLTSAPSPPFAVDTVLIAQHGALRVLAGAGVVGLRARLLAAGMASGVRNGSRFRSIRGR